MRGLSNTYFPIVILDRESDTIVAVGTLFIERKFLRGLASVGHIEDIAVDKRQQGKKLGLHVIQALTHISEHAGCYKTILNCSDANIRQFSPSLSLLLRDRDKNRCFWTAFYQKCGYEKRENEMVTWYPYSLALHTCSAGTLPQARYAPERARTPRL
jgi:glucosamine-phosphate N-acetyltransferase